jgi:tetratricopeptide (TPR) repeat protein
MRRFVTHSVVAWVASGLAVSGLGCATFTGATSEEDARKATSHLDVGTDHFKNDRGKRAEAERHVRRALELFPDYHDARLFLSAVLVLEKRYAEVIPECDRLINDPTFPSPWSALTNRGWAEYKLGRAPQARETLALALEYRRSYWPATLALAILEGDAGHRPEAIRLYQQIIALGPGASVEAEVNYRLAEIYVALGQRREAKNHLATSVARAPDSQWAKKSQEYLKRLP